MTLSEAFPQKVKNIHLQAKYSHSMPGNKSYSGEKSMSRRQLMAGSASRAATQGVTRGRNKRRHSGLKTNRLSSPGRAASSAVRWCATSTNADSRGSARWTRSRCRSGTSECRAWSVSCLDCSDEENCRRVCEGATEVYNLAADMGGMGFIERFRIACLRSILINTHMIEAAYRAGAQRYFFSSSACAYNTRPAAGPAGAGTQGIRRLSGHGRTRLRLGEADVRDVLPGVLARTRSQDVHRAVPQRVRSARHVGRRTRKGPGRDLPQGDRSQGPRHLQIDLDLG